MDLSIHHYVYAAMKGRQLLGLYSTPELAQQSADNYKKRNPRHITPVVVKTPVRDGLPTWDLV